MIPDLRASQVAEARRGWRALDPIPRAEASEPNLQSNFAMQIAAGSRGALEEVLHLCGYLHPAVRRDLEVEARRLWAALGISDQIRSFLMELVQGGKF